MAKKKNEKMKPLRLTVRRPLFIATTVISITMFVFFNFVISIMLYSRAVGDLKYFSRTIEQLVETEESFTPDAPSVIKLYETAVGRSEPSYDINMVVVDKSGGISYSAEKLFEGEGEALLEGMLHNSHKISDNMKLVFANDDVLVISPLNISSARGEEYHIYVSLRSLLYAVKSSNEALAVIIVFAFLCFIIASHIISDNMSKPIKELSDHMELIGDGDFTPVAVNESSEELNKLTISINEMLGRLQAYNKAHTVSMQNLSHDLRTPLMSIGGYAEAIKYGVMDSPEDAADVIIKESKRLTKVVEKLLILSEIDNLNQPVDMVPVDLETFLKEETERIEGYAMQNSVEIVFKFQREGMKILADVQLLSAIVRNLLSNAIRYAKDTVTIEVYDKGVTSCLAISDNGPGLSEEDLKYLFTRYYVGKTGHSGLGLSAAKSAAEYMGCTLKGENREPLSDVPGSPPAGAIFTVSFLRYE